MSNVNTILTNFRNRKRRGHLIDEVRPLQVTVREQTLGLCDRQRLQQEQLRVARLARHAQSDWRAANRVGAARRRRRERRRVWGGEWPEACVEQAAHRQE